MGKQLFGIDIAAEVNDAMSEGLPKLILTKDTEGSRTSGSLTSGKNKSPSSYNCSGFVDVYKDDEIDGTTVVKGDHKILIIGDSIEGGVVPAPGDRITDDDGDTYTIQKDGVIRDPAAATYLCHVR